MRRVVGLVLYIAAWIADKIKCAVRKIFRKDDCDC